MGRARLQELPEVLDHRPAVLPMTQLMVPESLHEDPLLLEITVAPTVSFLAIRMSVAGTVEFDGQPGFDAEKVEVVRAEGFLATELIAGKTPITEDAPQATFGPSGVPSQLPGLPAGGHGEAKYLTTASATSRKIWKSLNFLREPTLTPALSRRTGEGDRIGVWGWGERWRSGGRLEVRGVARWLGTSGHERRFAPTRGGGSLPRRKGEGQGEGGKGGGEVSQSHTTC